MYKTYANFNVTNSIFVSCSTLLPSKFSRKILTLLCFTAFKINYQKKCFAVQMWGPYKKQASCLGTWLQVENEQFTCRLFFPDTAQKKTKSYRLVTEAPHLTLFVHWQLTERACRFKNGSTMLLIPLSSIVNPVEL